MFFLLLTLLGFQQSFGDAHFTPLRIDLSVPAECRQIQLKHFQLPPEIFYVGREGAADFGFTFEYPIKRRNATILWKYFKAHANRQNNDFLLEMIKNDPELKRDYEIILNKYQEWGFSFKAEGEVLEVLAIQHLYQEFPENIYFITGGIEYHKKNSGMTIGELDVYVGRRDTCEPVALGEVKLGTAKMLKKAKMQLYRFENFLIDHLGLSFGKEYKPIELAQDKAS